jgi:DNA-binding NarL/FixJ family response regulator
MAYQVGVVLVAGNRLLREALSRVLNKRHDIRVIASLAHGDDIDAHLADRRPRVLLCDALAATPFDIAFVQSLTRRYDHLKVVLIGMEEDREAFLAAVRAGVAGYVLNEASAMDVVGAVRAVARGEAVCPPRLVTHLLAHVSAQFGEGPSTQVRQQLGLSKREQQLVPLIAAGLTNKEIATHLGLSEQTVKNHLHRMLRKAGARDRLAIVERCRLEGLDV